MNRYKLGIDEAGRGCVLGPLVMVGLCIDADQVEQLNSLGVQDSKLFGSSNKAKRRREELCATLQHWPHQIEIADVETIDDYVSRGGLNELEREMATRIIKGLPKAQVMLDGALMFGPLCNEHIKAENKADQNHMEVAAASIIAKHLRDKAVVETLAPFEADFGQIKGGGYANPGTLAFVQWHHETYGSLPQALRKSYQWQAIHHLR